MFEHAPELCTDYLTMNDFDEPCCILYDCNVMWS